jgi:hypothetical protein
MVGAKIGVFTSTRSRRVLEPIAEEFGVRVFDLPIDFGALKALLDSCAENAGP